MDRFLIHTETNSCVSFDVENMFSGPQCSTQNVKRRNIDKANLITRRHFQALELARSTGFYKNPVLNETSKFSKNIRKKSVSETRRVHNKPFSSSQSDLCIFSCTVFFPVQCTVQFSRHATLVFILLFVSSFFSWKSHPGTYSWLRSRTGN